MACNNCKKSKPCGCPIRLSSFCVKYDLDLRLPNIPINPGNNLQDILINLDSKILEIEQASSSQNLSFNETTNELSITGGNSVVLPTGSGGGIESVVGGTNITVDNTDPDNPVVNSSFTETITTLVDNGTTFTYTSENGTVTTVDLTAGSGGLQSVVAGTNVSVNNTDPLNPIVSSTDTNTTNQSLSITRVGSEITISVTDSEANIISDSFTEQEGLPVAAQNDFLYNNGTNWIKVTPVTDIQEGLTGNTVTLPSTPITTNPYYIDVVVGTPRFQGATNDYTISGNTLTFNFTLQTTDKIRTKYIIA